MSVYPGGPQLQRCDVHSRDVTSSQGKNGRTWISTTEDSRQLYWDQQKLTKKRKTIFYNVRREHVKVGAWTLTCKEVLRGTLHNERKSPSILNLCGDFDVLKLPRPSCMSYVGLPPQRGGGSPDQKDGIRGEGSAPGHERLEETDRMFLPSYTHTGHVPPYFRLSIVLYRDDVHLNLRQRMFVLYRNYRD